MLTMTAGNCVSTSMFINKREPRTMNAALTWDKVRYFPVFVMSCPATTLPMIKLIIIGDMTKPLFWALSPMTPWMNNGRNMMLPNIAMETKMPRTSDVVKMRFLNREGVITGSDAFCSNQMNKTRTAVPLPNSTHMTGDVQAYFVPAQVNPNKTGTRPAMSRSEPNQSTFDCSLARTLGRANRTPIKASMPNGRLM